MNSDDVEREAKEKRLQKAALDELDELEDDEDEAVLAKIREQRLAEMRQQAARGKAGDALREITKPRWTSEVTDAAYLQKVVVLLYKPGDDWCSLLEKQLATVATRFPKIKFVKIVYREAIAEFPEQSLPCLLIYDKDHPIQQIVGRQHYGGGAKMNADDVEWALHVRGVLRSEMEENPRSTGADSESSVKYNYVGAAHLEDY